MPVPDDASYGSGHVSQNQWPASRDPSDIGLVKVTLPNGKSFRAAPGAAPALKEMAIWWSNNIEPIETIGSYNYRTIRGESKEVSNHGSGTAIDINEKRHPLGDYGTVPKSKRDPITKKAASLGLRWGGNYRGRKDEMHFEMDAPPPTRVTPARGTTAGAGAGGLGLLVIGALALVFMGGGRRG